LNPFKFLHRQSIQDSVANVAEKEKGYFCSELVALIFKQLELLPKDISSAQYWPGSFSSEAKLKLENGAFLGNEYLIAFE